MSTITKKAFPGAGSDMAGRKKKVKVSSIVIYTFLCITLVIYLFPLLWIVLGSLKSDSDILNHPFSLPQTLMLAENYEYAWSRAHLGTALMNSLGCTVATLIGCLSIGSLAAFAIARIDFRFNKLMMTYFLTGMMVPIHCLLMPLIRMISSVNLGDSLVGLTIPYITFALPLTIYIMCGFFKTIPHELFESCCVDGCGLFRTFWQIALPISKSGLFITGLMTFVNTWNELVLAMCLINTPSLKTLPVALTAFVGPYETDYGHLFAAIFIAVLPTIVAYCAFSNQIVEGLTQGAVKG